MYDVKNDGLLVAGSGIGAINAFSSVILGRTWPNMILATLAPGDITAHVGDPCGDALSIVIYVLDQQ